jgi:hypothetical protein
MLQMPPPTGIAVLLARDTRNTQGGKKPTQFRFVCHNVPRTQQAYLYEPHGIDMLILLEMKGIPMQDIVTCLGLQNIENDNGSAVRVWKKNLVDGTTDLSVPGTIFFSHQALFVIAYRSLA